MSLTERSRLLREGRVGASEMAAFLPCGHPYHKQGDIYARLVHGVTRPSSALMDMGNVMEGAIFRLGRALLAQKGERCRRNGVSTVRPHIVATPDGYCSCGGVIEVKNVSHYGAELWLDGVVPPHYVAQVQTQMLLTGRDHAHVWALMEGVRFQSLLLEADPEWHRGIEYAVERFFADHVEPRIPPPDVPDELVLTVTMPTGTVHAEGALLDIGNVVAELTELKNDYQRQLDSARTRMEWAMADAGAQTVVAPTWIAEAKPVKSTGALSLWFKRKGSRK